MYFCTDDVPEALNAGLSFVITVIAIVIVAIVVGTIYFKLKQKGTKIYSLTRQTDLMITMAKISVYYKM